jgi:hypothetical protein
MPGRKKGKSSSSTALKELVTIAFAEDVDLAKQYKQLLEDNNIPAAIKIHSESESDYKGIPVMVPEDYLDEAHMLVESHNSGGDFYNAAFGLEDHDSDGYELDNDDDDELY